MKNKKFVEKNVLLKLRTNHLPESVDLERGTKLPIIIEGFDFIGVYNGKFFEIEIPLSVHNIIKEKMYARHIGQNEISSRITELPLPGVNT